MMNNILVVSASFRGGGSERLAVEFANAAAQMGYNVTFFVGVCEGPYQDELCNTIQLIEGEGRRFSKSIFQLARVLAKSKIEYIFCSQEYVISIVYFSRCISFQKPYLIGREASTPSINLNTDGVKTYVVKKIIGYAYKRLDKLIVPTDSVAIDLKRFYKGVNSVEVIHNPVDRDSLHELALEPVDFEFIQGRVYLVCVGRLVKSKGVHTIIKALHVLNDSKYHLLILGEGDYVENIKNLVRTLSLDGTVHFLGFKANPYSYMIRSDVFISASQYEGMPNSLIQALSLGVPCVSTLSTSVVGTLLSVESIFTFENEVELVSCINKNLNSGIGASGIVSSFLTPMEYVRKVLEVQKIP